MSVARPRGLRTVIRSLYCNMYGHDWDRKIPDPDLVGDSTCKHCGLHVVWDDTDQPRESVGYRDAATPKRSARDG